MAMKSDIVMVKYGRHSRQTLGIILILLAMFGIWLLPGNDTSYPLFGTMFLLFFLIICSIYNFRYINEYKKVISCQVKLFGFIPLKIKSYSFSDFVAVDSRNSDSEDNLSIVYLMNKDGSTIDMTWFETHELKNGKCQEFTQYLSSLIGDDTQVNPEQDDQSHQPNTLGVK